MNINYFMNKLDCNGLSVADLSKKIGMSESSLYKCIIEEKEFTIGDIKKIAHVLNLNTTEISNIFFKQYEIKYHSLTEHIGGAITQKDDDTYLIIINDSLDENHQHSALGHELAHLYLNHLESNRPDKDLDEEAEKYSKFFYKLYAERRI